MTNALSKDARLFVESIVSHLGGEKKQRDTGRLRSLLTKVTRAAKKEKNALVSSSVPLTSDEKMRVEKLLAKLMGHEIQVEYKTSNEVIAGIKIRVADWVLDSSFEAQLSKMREYLNA